MLRNKFQLEVAKTHIRKISGFLYRETDVDEHILNISVLLRTIVLPKVGSLLWSEICDLAKSVSNWDQGKFRKGILEPWTASTNQNLRELAEAALRSVALEYINRSGSKPPKAFLQSIEDLKTCDDIVITKPDKRSSVVVMDKSEYLRLLPEASINNTSKFRFVDSERPKTRGRPPKYHNPLLQKEKELKTLVRKILPKSIADALRPKGSGLAHLYGLPKTHKEQLTARSIGRFESQQGTGASFTF